MVNPNINIPKNKIAEFCHRWKVAEFSLFGSILTRNFRPDSDIDILVDFTPDAKWSLFEHAEMRSELMDLFKRKVDFVTKNGIKQSRNHIRRKAILDSMEVIYVP